MRISYTRSAASLLVVLLLACPQQTAVWVEQGSTDARLRFRIADRRHGTGRVAPDFLRVDRCGAWERAADAPQPLWGAATDGELAVIEYGVMPPGAGPLMGQADTALTLVPGCYEVMINGTGRAVFDVAPDGSVRERLAGT